MSKNISTPLNFSKHINSTWLTNVKDYQLQDRTVVVNLGNEGAKVFTEQPQKVLLPRTSTIVKGVTIQSADSLVLLEIPDPSKVADVVSEEGWIHLSEQDPGFPADVPLYKSRQFEVGTAKFDPYFVTGQSDCVKKNCIKEYKVKVNLWYSPPNTDCQIHNHHTDPEMLEVHTQVHGTGRMQKFKTKDFKDLYEDVFMAPGFTHSPFTGVHETGSFYYGWHQYYSDTDCIWMANEFHPIPVQ